jgi:DNA-binding NarL/FixJ family response regulator
MPVRILIADDDSTIRNLVRRLLEEHPEWSVCGEAQDGADAVAKAGELAPDLVVLDLAMPRMNGINAAQQIAAQNPRVPMLLLTVQQVSSQLAAEARKAGFRGAVCKGNGVEVVNCVAILLRQRTCFLVDDSTTWAQDPVSKP